MIQFKETLLEFMKNIIPSAGLFVWYRKAKFSILSTYHTLHNTTVIHRYWSIFKETLLEFIKFKFSFRA
jgi:hypothetical protein